MVLDSENQRALLVAIVEKTHIAGNLRAVMETAAEVGALMQAIKAASVPQVHNPSSVLPPPPGAQV